MAKCYGDRPIKVDAMPVTMLLLTLLGFVLMAQNPARAEENFFIPGNIMWQSVAEPDDFRMTLPGESGIPAGLRFREPGAPASRSGARAWYEATENIKAYAGAGFEREQSYLRKALYSGYSHSLGDSGATFGVGELGLTLKPSAKSDFYIFFNTKGYAGKRDGSAWNIEFKWEF